MNRYWMKQCALVFFSFVILRPWQIPLLSCSNIIWTLMSTSARKVTQTHGFIKNHAIEHKFTTVWIVQTIGLLTFLGRFGGHMFQRRNSYLRLPFSRSTRNTRKNFRRGVWQMAWPLMGFAVKGHVSNSRTPVQKGLYGSANVEATPSYLVVYM